MERPDRRELLRSCVGASVAFFAGCTRSNPDETPSAMSRTTTHRTTAPTTDRTETKATEMTTDTTTIDIGSPPETRLPFTVYPDEVGRIVTADLSSTADCTHAAALATDRSEAEQFDWTTTDEGVREFVRATDFEMACLLAGRTTNPGPVEYEVDHIVRETETTLRVHTIAEGVPGPSTSDIETRLVRVSLDRGPSPRERSSFERPTTTILG
ncbi:hypothetical protein [Halorussus caseinilyticus]|uniref:Uncharacterized protein n=1 Tax=Halorussus caseinilyticus TaxID=3034025 RepID=A0ABD5WSN4_9EURY